MIRFIVMASSIVLAWSSVALAAGLTDGDYRHLQAEYGLGRHSQLIADMAADEQAKLHDVINDPSAKEYPQRRDTDVANYLFNIHMRQCQTWAQSHPGPEECPPTVSPAATPGQTIADRQCNACHLFGTTSAPSFYKLAKAGGWDEKKLAGALGRGHQMSPISLDPTQLKDLATYIAALK